MFSASMFLLYKNVFYMIHICFISHITEANLFYSNSTTCKLCGLLQLKLHKYIFKINEYLGHCFVLCTVVNCMINGAPSGRMLIANRRDSENNEFVRKVPSGDARQQP